VQSSPFEHWDLLVLLFMLFKLAFSPEIQKLQQIARGHSQKIIDENQKLRSELESKMQDLDLKSKQLDDLTLRTDYDRRNLQQEKEKVSPLPLTILIV
jgi:hypothetical protein